MRTVHQPDNVETGTQPTGKPEKVATGGDPLPHVPSPGEGDGALDCSSGTERTVPHDLSELWRRVADNGRY